VNALCVSRERILRIDSLFISDFDRFSLCKFKVSFSEFGGHLSSSRSFISSDMVLVAFIKNLRRSSFLSYLVPQTAQPRGMVGEYGDVIFTSLLYLQHEGLHGGLSVEGDHSAMVEDAPGTTEHGHRRRVMGTILGVVPGEVSVSGIH
jgi:hypothetical protein